jgi:hypothetical protein
MPPRAKRGAAKASPASKRTRKHKNQGNDAVAVDAVAVAIEQPATPTRAVTKPAPANPPGKYKYWVYTLHDGRMQSFENYNDSMDFQEEYGALITNQETFSTKAQMMAYLSAGKNGTGVTIKTEPGVVPDRALLSLSPEEKTRLTKINSMIDACKPHDTMKLWWKTNPMTSAAAYILDPLNHMGEGAWYIKRPFDMVLVNYFKATPTDNPFVNEFFTNIQTAKMRDEDKGPNDAKMSKRVTDTKEFTNYRMWTHTSLPYGSFKSIEDEDNYVIENLNAAMATLRTAQRTPIFMEVVKGAYSERMYEKMMEENKRSSNFPTFIQKFRIKCLKLQNLNKLVVLDDAKTIHLLLLKHGLPTRKYPREELVFENTDDGDDNKKPAAVTPNAAFTDCDASTGENADDDLASARVLQNENDDDETEAEDEE